MTYIIGMVFAETVDEAAQYVFDRLQREGLKGTPRIFPPDTIQRNDLAGISGVM